MSRDDRSDELKELIKSGQSEKALELAKSPVDYQESEDFVFAVLKAEVVNDELLDAALEAFLNTRENWDPKHGYWVHSLSHFTKDLWKLRKLAWIKRLSEVSFKGANELGDTNCSGRLVYDFDEHALWSDHPVEVGQP